MVQCVRHFVLPRLKKDAGLPFSSVDHPFPALNRGAFLPRRQEIKMANPLYQKHIISINDLSRDDLNLVLATAAKLESKPATRAVEAQSHCQLFLRSLYRTRLSFETSMHRLGASVVGFSDSANTSLGKGRNAGRYHFGYQHLRRCDSDASSAGRCGAPGHRVFRQCTGTECR